MKSLRVLQGDALDKLRELPSESVHCCVTSPPYWGLRDYGAPGQLGLEKTPEQYVAKMVEIFREVRRVLRHDGTLWLNLGDSYYNYRPGAGQALVKQTVAANGQDLPQECARRGNRQDGLKEKDLCGIPWRVAFALQADGWYLRQDIIWSKPNPMPESVTDRCTKAHEYLFLLTKSPRYYFDAEAIKEQVARDWDSSNGGNLSPDGIHKANGEMRERGGSYPVCTGNRNKRSVWTVATAPYPEAHFATYPPDLIKPCIMAGTSAKGCCAKCGAPWERVVERSREYDHETYRDGKTMDGPYAKQSEIRNGILPTSKTLGWQPTCECDEVFDLGQLHHCTVLDPFAGSGTTGAVALELGRKAILIELNPKYVELIEQRCTTTIGLALA